VLLCVTASHKTAAFDLLERLSIHTRDVAPLIAAHDDCVQGAVVLATCNRFEAYIDMDEPVTAAAAVGEEAALLAVEAATGVRADELDGSYRVITGNAVAQHLFSVAAGLESVVVGEGEIAGQVRRALIDARRLDTSSTELERLFQRASQAQRGVKNATALGRAGRSMVRLALDLTESRIADWTAQRVLLVGTGDYAATTVAALRDRGVTDIAVHSPSGRAAAFALKHGLRAIDATGYAAEAASADLVLTCTTAEHHVLDAAVLRSGGAVQRKLVIDLGLPRNVDPDVAEVAGVTLLDLETIRLHAPLDELQATDAAHQIVRDAARRFGAVGDAQAVTPGLVALRRHVLELVEVEVSRARDRGDDGRVEQAMRHLAGVLLHTPTVRAQDLAAEGRADEYLAALHTLFGLEPGPPASVAGTDEELAAG
jgi:glutamyl-tRNA reductase